MDCKKLTFLTIRTARLTSKTIGTKAFIGTPKKLTVSVPKKQKTAYTRLLRSKGVSERLKSNNRNYSELHLDSVSLYFVWLLAK